MSTPEITSAHNPKLKELRKLHDRKHRDRSGLFLAEGEDLLEAATSHEVYPRMVFYDTGELRPDEGLLAAPPPTVELVPVEQGALRSAGSLGSGSRAIGVFEQRWSRPDAEVVLYLHDVSDPGNVGAILRSTLALVEGAVVLSPATADPFGPKAVRASMGAIFVQPVVRASFADLRDALSGHRTVALLPERGRRLDELELPADVIFCLGAERSGLPEEIARSCDEVTHVPMRFGAIGSLNVAMTATLCAYEYLTRVHRLSSADA